MSLTLYLDPFSSYCRKAVIAFYENAAAFEARYRAEYTRLMAS